MKRFTKFGINLSRWVADDKSAVNNSIGFGYQSIHLCWLSKNSHGTQEKGQPWNQETVKGWKLKRIPLLRLSAGVSQRIILYTPSGAWWHADIYLTFGQRRYKTNREYFEALRRRILRQK